MQLEDSQTPSHPIALEGETPLETGGHLRADTLTDSVLLLLVLTVLQRGVGFIREIFFCRCLSAEQLGLWDMAYGFLMLAGPLVVLSLPGAFGRYVARYRQMGQLRPFVRRTALFCAAMAVPAVVCMCLARNWFSYLVFGEPDRANLVVLVGLSLLTVVVFNFLHCLSNSLRNIRMVARLELAHSLIFATVGLGLIWGWSATAASMVVAHGVACLFCVCGGLIWLARIWGSFPQSEKAPPQRELWSRLLPFAGWLMIINLFWNLFDVVDRYMILHFSSGSPAEALAEVGNYRSSRVLPLLLATVTSMIASVALPHLSHDWESGRRQRVSERLNLLVKVWALVLTAGGAVILLFAPLLFQVALKGKFAGGLHVLPWTLTYCTWFGLIMIVQTYLWCAEKAKTASVVALIGVGVNVGLNLVLLPRLGLLGAVLATSAANFTALALMVALAHYFGFRAQRSTVTLLLLPASVILGPWIALLVLLAFLLEIVGSDRILSREEKAELMAGCAQYLDRIPWLRRASAVSDAKGG